MERGRDKSWRRFAFVLFAIALTLTAWLDDDCFITLRVANNWVHGFGPRWNVVERVQAATSPAWLVLVTLAHALTREGFFTLLALSMLVSAAAVGEVCFARQRRADVAAASVLALVCSPSFLEYSTSGLELPLAHLLLPALVRRLPRTELTAAGTRTLALLGSGLVLTRPDLALLVLPVYALLLAGAKQRRALLWPVLAGACPLLAWEAFSLVYYGALAPNTAPAKLGTGEPLTARLLQGLAYFENQLRHDPVSCALLALGCVVAVRRDRPAHARALMLGVVLYLGYVLAIGGCFMVGRYFTAPLLVSVLVLGAAAGRLSRPALYRAMAATVVVALLRSTPPDRGVSDEHTFYYAGTGLLPNLVRPGPHPSHPFADLGRFYAARPGVHVVAAAGMPGYFAGPGAHLVDRYALADPLLARLPALRVELLPNVQLGIGHHARKLPIGYVRTLATGHDHFEDRKLAALYFQLALVHRGPLFSAERWLAILRLHTGGYDALADPARARDSFTPRLPLAELTDLRSPFGFDVVALDRVRLTRIELPEPLVARALRLRVGSAGAYEVRFVRGRTELATRWLAPQADAREQIREVELEVPQSAAGGFDALLLRSAGARGPAGIAGVAVVR